MIKPLVALSCILVFNPTVVAMNSISVLDLLNQGKITPGQEELNLSNKGLTCLHGIEQLASEKTLSINLDHNNLSGKFLLSFFLAFFPKLVYITAVSNKYSVLAHAAHDNLNPPITSLKTIFIDLSKNSLIWVHPFTSQGTFIDVQDNPHLNLTSVMKLASSLGLSWQGSSFKGSLANGIPNHLVVSAHCDYDKLASTYTPNELLKTNKDRQKQ